MYLNTISLQKDNVGCFNEKYITKSRKEQISESEPCELRHLR